MRIMIILDVKLPGHGSDHSHATGVVVRNQWSYTPVLPIRLHDADADNFTFTFAFS
jgi:hypothetical protein